MNDNDLEISSIQVSEEFAKGFIAVNIVLAPSQQIQVWAIDNNNFHLINK